MAKKTSSAEEEKAPKKGKDSRNKEKSDSSFSEEEHLFEDWDELSEVTEEESRFSRALEGLVPGILKRGVEGLVSEDGIRATLLDRGMPREAVGFILGQVDVTRREVVRIVSKEVRLFLENVDLGGELTKILTSVSFEIRTEVRFIPNDASVRPSVKNRVKVKGNREEEEEEDFEEPVEKKAAGSSKDDDQLEKPKRRRWPLGRGKEGDGEDSPEK